MHHLSQRKRSESLTNLVHVLARVRDWFQHNWNRLWFYRPGEPTKAMATGNTVFSLCQILLLTYSIVRERKQMRNGWKSAYTIISWTTMQKRTDSDSLYECHWLWQWIILPIVFSHCLSRYRGLKSYSITWPTGVNPLVMVFGSFSTSLM